MINVFKLGYVDFKCNDVKKMHDYYENTIGFTKVATGDKGEFYISSGVDHHNIILRQGDASELQTIGFQIEESSSLQEVQKYLRTQGITSNIQTDTQPGVGELLHLQDPDGFNIHLYHKMDTPAPGYKLGHVTPHKLGHLAIGSLKPEASIAFYMDILNFRYTDRIGERATFLTCNADHHVLNISNFGHRMMHHIAFELKDSAHHVTSADYLATQNYPIVWGPSRHTAGHNIASYHHDPELNVIELYTEMDQYIPELDIFDPRPWHEELPLRPKVWEHNCTWYTKFESDIIDSVLKKVKERV